MDPALQEQLHPNLDPDEVIEAIIRLQAPFQYPNKIKVVSSFGDVVTVRVRRADVQEVYKSPALRSFKAKRILGSVKDRWSPDAAAVITEPSEGMDAVATATGKGVIVAVLDWGADFLHRDFINAAGKTRFHAIWDQSRSGKKANRYGYGTIHSHEDINEAIQSQDPYRSLSYKPDDGAHGTLVTGIAAGNGQSGKPGIAPEADLVFVHLAADERVVNPHLNLGDSMRLLEGLDFVRSIAGDRPLAINMSLGAHGGSHDGLSLVEIALDNFLASRPNTMICQSVGNYFSNKTHHHGQVWLNKSAEFTFRINHKLKTNNELEYWYSGKDEFLFHLIHPGSGIEISCEPGKKETIYFKGQEVGRAYNRLLDPNNGKNNINLFLDQGAPSGSWQVRLIGIKIEDGRYDAWIERENKKRQGVFEDKYATTLTTNGTVCNGFHTIVVGSVNNLKQPSVFSSSGPTTDGRSKPDLVAFGEKITGPRAAPPDTRAFHNTLKVDTGTSFSTPQVTGTVALMLEHAKNEVDALTIRNLLLASAERLTGLSDTDALRVGNGLLQTKVAVASMKQYQGQLSSDTKNQKNMQNQTFAPFTEQVLSPSAPSAGDIFLTPNSGPRSLPLMVGAPQVFSDLDAALSAALTPGRNSCIIRGQLYAGGNFSLYELNLPICPVTPLVVRFQPAFTDICCVVLEGFAAYFASNLVQPANRWEQMPDLSAFYRQSQTTRANQRGLWINKMISRQNQLNPAIVLGGVTPSPDLVRRLSAPELRLILISFADILFPVIDVDETDTHGRHWVGAKMSGVTMLNLPVPLSEPECYLKVISDREGKLEAINAYDGGAGISIGTVQFNAQNKALHKLLWKIWQQDRELFLLAFGPLGWAMSINANGTLALTVTPSDGNAPFTILSTEKDRFVNYLHSGSPGVSTKSIAFRRTMAQRFRIIVVRPTMQSLINEITAEVYAVPGLSLIHRNGIPLLNTSQPSLELFQLKSALLSAYVRATGCAANLIQALNKYSTVSNKLSHLSEEIDHLSPINTFNCADAFRVRLANQVREAGVVFREVQSNSPQHVPSALPPARAPVTPAEPPVTEWMSNDSVSDFEDSDNSLWSNWKEMSAE